MSDMNLYSIIGYSMIASVFVGLFYGYIRAFGIKIATQLWLLIFGVVGFIYVGVYLVSVGAGR